MKRIYIIIISAILLSGCTKSKFLDERPRTSLIIPTSLSDMRSLLDNDQIFLVTPALGELCSDNYYLTGTFWRSLSIAKERNAYNWQKDIFEGTGAAFDWNAPYQQILYTNLVLEGLDKIAITNETENEWKSVKGSAHFLRAYAYYQLSQVFCPVYDSSTANNELGLPLRTKSDVTEILSRANLQATYELILQDLKEAIRLLPPNFPSSLRNRPSKPGAFAQMARVLISMRAYSQARLYADSSLQLYNTLIDYNTVPSTGTLPFTTLNNETIYQSAIGYLYSGSVIRAASGVNTIIDTILMQSYHTNDLRRTVFFTRNNTTGVMNLRAGYSASVYPFSGLATDEVYLIRAECAARMGDLTSALSDLNRLLQFRFRTGTFIPLQTTNATIALNWILTERRKELCFRGIRWSDLRRLNKEGANIMLTRIIDGITYTLAPNSPLYTLPIPPDEIGTSGIQQNNR